jgi:hypothetical protein
VLLDKYQEKIVAVVFKRSLPVAAPFLCASTKEGFNPNRKSLLCYLRKKYNSSKNERKS